MVGRRRLEDGEEAWRCCRFDATSAGEDLLALRTTPFQGGEDDEGIVLASCWSVDTLGQLSRYVMSKVVLIRPACHLCWPSL